MHLQDKAPAQTRIPTQTSNPLHSVTPAHSVIPAKAGTHRPLEAKTRLPRAQHHLSPRPNAQTSQGRIPWQQLLLLAILAVLCYYVRGVGATVVVSMVLWLLFHRQMRGAIVIGGVSAVLIGLWQVRNAIVLPVTIYSINFSLKTKRTFPRAPLDSLIFLCA